MSDTTAWLDVLEYDDLPESHKKLADVIGVEATLKLCRVYGGAQWYIPGLNNLYDKARAKMIRKEYNGSNVRGLAHKFGLSTRAVYEIVRGENPQIDGQISVFDLEARNVV